MRTDIPVDGDGAFSRRVVDKIVASLFHGSSVVGTVHTTIRAAGSKASLARTMGILGHAFTFSMNKGCGRFQWEGNIDWWLFFERLPALDVGFEHFQIGLHGIPMRAHNREGYQVSFCIPDAFSESVG